MRFTIPGRTISAANAREHHMAKAKRVKRERAKVMALCPGWDGPPLLVVTLFRYGTHELDSDNLQGALKGHRDAIARKLKVDDGSRLVAWEYRQATCGYGQERVEVLIEAVNPERWTEPVYRPMESGLTTLEEVFREPPRFGVAVPATYRRGKT